MGRRRVICVTDGSAPPGPVDPPDPPVLLVSGDVAVSHLEADASENIYAALTPAYPSPSGVNDAQVYKFFSVKHLMKTDEEGNLDISFRGGIGTGFSHSVTPSAYAGGPQRPIYKLLWNSNTSRLLVCGMFNRINGVAVPSGIVALNTTTGLRDAAWNAGGAGLTYSSTTSASIIAIEDMVLRPDGKIVVMVGYYDSANPPRYNGVAVPPIFCLNADGTLDATFEGGFFGTSTTAGDHTDAYLIAAPDNAVYAYLGTANVTLGFYRWASGTPSLYSGGRTVIARLNSSGAPTGTAVVPGIETTYPTLTAASFGVYGKNTYRRYYKNTLSCYTDSDGSFVAVMEASDTLGAGGIKFVRFSTTMVLNGISPAVLGAFIRTSPVNGQAKPLLMQPEGDYLAILCSSSSGFEDPLVTVRTYVNAAAFKLGSLEKASPHDVTSDVLNNAIWASFTSTVAKTPNGKYLIGSDFVSPDGISLGASPSSPTVGFVRLRSDGVSDTA